MKKVLVWLFAVFTALSVAACGERGGTPGTDATTEKLKVFAPDGAPAFALSGLMGDDTYDIEVVASNTIASKITSGDADLVIAPTNAVVNLFNKGQDYRIVAQATRGNLFVVGAGGGETLELSDLVGAVVGVIGQGQTPDLVFRYILGKNDIAYEVSDTAVDGKIALRYYADGPAVIQAAIAGQIGYGLLGEPAATNASAKIQGAKMLDVQALYEAAEEGNTYGFPQAVLAVKYSTYTARKAEVDAFLTAYAAAEDYAEEHPAEAVERVKNHMSDGVEASIQQMSAETAARCNISGSVLTEADKADINGYIQMILDLEAEGVADGSLASSVGGKLPDETIYIVGGVYGA